MGSFGKIAKLSWRHPLGRLAIVLILVALWGRGKASCQADSARKEAKLWAAEASANEIKVLKFDNIYLRYQVHIKDNKGDKVRDVIESKDGTVARLILLEGRPLTRQEDDAERDRLQAMLDSPSAFAKHIKTDLSGKKLAVDLVGQVPDAMLFSYAPGQPQRAGRDAGEAPEVVLDFTPNPHWSPPTMASELLTGLRGRAWIDTRTHYLTRLDGEVFRGVNFGWGFFAHIYPGATVLFEQVRVGQERWIFSRFSQHATVRALMLKTLQQNAEIRGTDFRPIPPMSYQDAIRLLLANRLPGL